MTTDLPPPPTPGDPGGTPTSRGRRILIAIGAAAVVGVLLGLSFASNGSGEYTVALLAYLAVLTVPVVAVVVGVRRARRHPGAGGREFLAGCLLTLGLEIGILVIVVGACLVAADAMY